MTEDAVAHVVEVRRLGSSQEQGALDLAGVPHFRPRTQHDRASQTGRVPHLGPLGEVDGAGKVRVRPHLGPLGHVERAVYDRCRVHVAALIDQRATQLVQAGQGQPRLVVGQQRA